MLSRQVRIFQIVNLGLLIISFFIVHFVVEIFRNICAEFSEKCTSVRRLTCSRIIHVYLFKCNFLACIVFIIFMQIYKKSQLVYINPLTPTVAIWVQL